MFDALVTELSDRYGLGDRSRELFGLVVGYIFNDRRGGFDGFVEGFRQQGHGDLVASWLGDAHRARPLNASDVGMVFGQGLLNDWGNRLGSSRATIAAAIAGVLPRLVAALAPGGRSAGNDAADAHDADVPYEGMRGEHAPRHDSAVTPRTATTPAPSTGDRVFDAPVFDAPVFDAPVFDAPVFDAPARERVTATVQDHATPSATTGLRREPVFIAPRASVPPAWPVGDNARPGQSSYAPRTRTDAVVSEPATRASTADDRAADMAAAFAAPSRHADAIAMDAVEFRRPMHRPPPKRSTAWVWLLLLVALVGAGGYAWQQGLLAPYIDLQALGLSAT